MLSEQEVQQYHESGYVTPDFRLPKETVDEIGDLHARLLKKHPRFNNYCPSLLAYDLGFLNFARTPQILDMVSQLIGRAHTKPGACANTTPTRATTSP